MPRIIDTAEVIPVIAKLCQKACYQLNDDLVEALKAAQTREESPYSKDALQLLVENAAYAKQEQIACCHDTGTAVVIMEIGQEISWTGAPLVDMVNEGVHYREIVAQILTETYTVSIPDKNSPVCLQR